MSGHKDPADRVLEKYAELRMQNFETRDTDETWKRFEALRRSRRRNAFRAALPRWAGLAAAFLTVVFALSYALFPQEVRALGTKLIDFKMELTGEKQANIGFSAGDNDPGEEIVETLTYEQARERASFPVLKPTYVPDKYSFVNCLYTELGPSAESVEGRYQSEDGFFLSFEQLYFYDSHGYTSGQVVDTDDTQVIKLEIRGAAGVLTHRQKDGLTTLTWATVTTQYTITGRITPEEALLMAESIN